MTPPSSSLTVTEARGLLEEIWHEALAAIDPATSVSEAAVRVESPTHVLAVGKAAAAMSMGAAKAWGQVPGLAITSDATPPTAGLRHLIGEHPIPGAQSLEAGHQAAQLADGLGPQHHLAVLLSGGASSLMELPIDGISLSDLGRTTALLMKAGADIEEINTVRSRLSQLKGGGLARLAAPSRVTTLAISDVVGDPPGVIGSGPTMPVTSGPHEALAVIDLYHLRDRIARPVVDALAALGGDEAVEEIAAEYRIVSNMAGAAQAAVEAAQERGLTAAVLTSKLTGEARRAATWAIEQARSSGDQISVLAGETTVVVRGDGAGGRNQEAALAAAIEMAGREGVVFLAAGTDGIDGPTSAAGGVVDGGSVGRAGSITSARDALQRNDSATWLKKAGDQLITGPTGTNVGDLWVIWTK